MTINKTTQAALNYFNQEVGTASRNDLQFTGLVGTKVIAIRDRNTGVVWMVLMSGTDVVGAMTRDNWNS